jgi:hypothetical protein
MSNLQQPGALAFDQQGRNLYVSEQGLNRVIVAQDMGDPPSNLSLSPASWTFPNEPIGGASQQEQFTLTNNSASPVSGVTIAFQPTAPATKSDFSLKSTSCVSTLGSNASCLIAVSFNPASTGALSSTVAVTDAGTDSASAALSGVGDDYQIQLASGQSQEVTVIQGKAATFHLQVIASGAFGQNGEQVSFFCPSGTPAQSTCTVTPPSVTPTAGSPASVTIAIQTSSNTSQPALAQLFPSAGPFSTGGRLTVIILFGLAAIIFVTAGRTFRPVRMAVLAVATVAIFSGCHHSTATSTATPVGATTLLIQGAALSHDGTPLQATRGITLIVDVVDH